ncbi:uncharacterized protein LOC121339051 isoform X2 [Onychostruthus taczanowskii]|uniref:uncharacterized protein LOC121339051 isoform X2 n=1 Tax=Onychostruthus taczanowskii TaxID=356909 RepID=UPI001B809CD2|nr:uncharacterized protein LOC121339051 isoform X2 [Onychostruthus taczanowskii]
MPPLAPECLLIPSLAPLFPRRTSGTPSYPTRSRLVTSRTPHSAHKCVPQPLKFLRKPPAPRGQCRVSISGVLAPPQPSPSPTSQALLRPRPRAPERAKPLLGSAPCSSTLDDPLVQWRLRRCRGEEPALDTPPVGRALGGAAAPRGSLQGLPSGRSCDFTGALQEAAPCESRDPPEALWPIGRRFCRHQGAPSPQAVSQEPSWRDPCWRPHDSHTTLRPMRSSSLETLQEALYSQSRDSRHAPRQISSSCCAPLHQGAPPCGKQESHEPLLQETFWESHDCRGALWCAPYWKSCDSKDALRPAREALPEPLCQGGSGLRSRDPREAPQPIRSSARDAHQGAPWQQPLGRGAPWDADRAGTAVPVMPRGPWESPQSRGCPLRIVPAAPQVLPRTLSAPRGPGCREVSALVPAASPLLGSCSRRKDNSSERALGAKGDISRARNISQALAGVR